MNRVYLIVLFDLFLFYFLFGHSLARRFSSRRRRVRLLLRDYERHFAHLLRRDRDILDQPQQAAVRGAIDELRTARTDPRHEVREACLVRYRDESPVELPARSASWVREYLEIFVVALALAFGVRGMFLQPFKIPTGSMQPTLFGIHFEALDEAPRLNPVKRFFQYLHYSRRYVDLTVTRSGYLEKVERAKPRIPFFPATIVQIGGVRYRVPGDLDTVLRHYPRIAELCRAARYADTAGVFVDRDEVLARGYLELGDHLFVDRTYLNYREPRRGDIIVFLTDNIRDMDGQGLGGRYYIKRLVGLPGDSVRIRDHQLFVRRPGDNEFRLAESSMRPAFERLYSHRGGYRGYCHLPNSQYLLDGDDSFELGPDQYFMLGDNSENSKDSRFWGTVPRANLVGRALFVWWPFSRRWGVTDRAEPLGYASPPTGE